MKKVPNVATCSCGGAVDRICNDKFETQCFYCACCGRRGDTFAEYLRLERLIAEKRKALKEQKIDLSGSMGICYDEVKFLGTTELFQTLDRLRRPLPAMIADTIIKEGVVEDSHWPHGDSRDADGKTWRDRGGLL